MARLRSRNEHWVVINSSDNQEHAKTIDTHWGFNIRTTDAYSLVERIGPESPDRLVFVECSRESIDIKTRSPLYVLHSPLNLLSQWQATSPPDPLLSTPMGLVMLPMLRDHPLSARLKVCSRALTKRDKKPKKRRSNVSNGSLIDMDDSLRS